ncbi:related to kinesin-related protein KLPA [Cephalotrichum gorgonifer]|uniref:Kinesin-like protein n=1 Tax=Cephalotrichum gorgonifer TaxID=2041049 RepID=A0AAE8MRC8_9PEZI|nr:related to kinesin-related protein KLPA [Cephalotrichum gorgonifer]
MESDSQDLRASRLGSRLRPPSTQIPKLPGGLSELSDSQSNARSQIAMPATGINGVKRGLPQPAPIPESKRKPLSQQAAEYPAKATATASTTISAGRSNVQGVSLVGAGTGIKQPSRYGAQATRPPPATSFTTSRGPDTRNPYGRPKTSHANHSRSVSARSRPGERRPQSSYGNHAEEEMPGDSCMSTKLPLPHHSRTSISNTPKITSAHAAQTSIPFPSVMGRREVSLSTAFSGLSLRSKPNRDSTQGDQAIPKTQSPVLAFSPLNEFMANVTFNRGGKSPPKTPGRTHRTSTRNSVLETPFTPGSNLMHATEAFHELLKSEVKRTTSPTKSPPPYLNKYSNLRNFSAWDVNGRLGSIEQEFARMKSTIEETDKKREAWNDSVELYKSRVAELQQERDELLRTTGELKSDVGRYQDQATELKRKAEEAEWRHSTELDRIRRDNERARDDLQRSIDSEVDHLKRTHREELEALKRHYGAELDDERRERARQLEEAQRQMGSQQQDLRADMQKKDDEAAELRVKLEGLRADLDRETALKNTLQASLAEMSAANITMEAKMNSLRSQIEFLESDSKAQSDSFSDMEARLQEANAAAEEAKRKLIKEETERRVLFNKYQELKGNIRVMCRVRPVLRGSDEQGAEAGLLFPDEKTSAKIGVLGPEERSSMGTVTRKEHPFEFDRVFTPDIGNEEVFGEISQLVQSALDGYNVCIFCYGQTGSGKTYTMSSADGMIPRATHMIYETVRGLEEKSWSYTMEGSFVEVYNEELHDLLTPSGDKRKLEIRHDEVRKQTAVVGCKTVTLDSPGRVEAMLEEAQANRSVAATKANERSSRSHSVFILRLVGENAATGERCEGTLNLVDLAGSERLKHSQAEGDRMRETQNINKSLSCLGDVIDALGKGSGHVPYRNSRLTHLLQYSLGGNSKTLMFVMVSPLESHLKETLTSLRFAAKVHNTHIGTAKSTKKIKERGDA